MRRYAMKQRGQGIIEYLVISGMVGLASVVAIACLGSTVRSHIAAVAHETAIQQLTVTSASEHGSEDSSLDRSDR